MAKAKKAGEGETLEQQTSKLAKKGKQEPVTAPIPSGPSKDEYICMDCGVIVHKLVAMPEGGGDYKCKSCYSGRKKPIVHICSKCETEIPRNCGVQLSAGVEVCKKCYAGR